MTDYETLIATKMLTYHKYIERSKLDFKQYQFDGVQWCIDNELRKSPPCNVRGGFIADEMGLGKTIIMIATFLSNLLPRTLIILPPVLIDQWVDQIYKTTGHRPIVFHGDNKKTITLPQLQASLIVIATYSAISLVKETEKVSLLHQVDWSRIVFDEAHHLRNKKTTRFIGAKMLKSPIRWLISGTPIQNNKNDFYNLCSAIGLPPSFTHESDNLRIIAKNFILKRSKKQVGILLPSCFLENETVAWQNEEEQKLAAGFHSDLHFSKIAHTDPDVIEYSNTMSLPLQRMFRAKQTCILPKMMTSHLDKLYKSGLLSSVDSFQEAIQYSSKLDAVCQFILERKDNGSGKLIFCHFRQEIDEIADRLLLGGMTKVFKFDGRTNHASRAEILSDQNQAIILQIQTGCEGLNLQDHYSEIYFVSPHWNPAIEDQAIARCHRIGQKKQVFVYRFEMDSFLGTQKDSDSVEDEDKDPNKLVSSMTLDNYITSVQQNKRNISRELL